jgi:hypothetical protein
VSVICCPAIALQSIISPSTALRIQYGSVPIVVALSEVLVTALVAASIQCVENRQTASIILEYNSVFDIALRSFGWFIVLFQFQYNKNVFNDREKHVILLF